MSGNDLPCPHCGADHHAVEHAECAERMNADTAPVEHDEGKIDWFLILADDTDPDSERGKDVRAVMREYAEHYAARVVAENERLIVDIDSARRHLQRDAITRRPPLSQSKGVRDALTSAMLDAAVKHTERLSDESHARLRAVLGEMRAEAEAGGDHD